MLNLKKKENEFFIYLKEFAYEASKAAKCFDELVNDYSYENAKKRAILLKECETDCDKLTHKIFIAIRESFVTPFDREDLHIIVKQMDDIVDGIESVAARFTMFDVHELRDEALIMSKLIVEATGELATLFNHLSEIKKNDIAKEQIIAVNLVENKGDVVFREAITRLFKEEKDPIELIKWKHIFEKLETTLDSCESVANITEGVIMKYV